MSCEIFDGGSGYCELMCPIDVQEIKNKYDEMQKNSNDLWDEWWKLSVEIVEFYRKNQKILDNKNGLVEINE
jgi:hypothetical protein